MADAHFASVSASDDGDTEGLIARRRARIRFFFERISAARPAGAADCFTEDAVVMRVSFSAGRVDGAEMVARGRPVIREWLSALADRHLSAAVVSCETDEDVFVVRCSWSLDGFHGERVHSTSLGIYEFEGDRITRLRVSSAEEEGEGCPES
ncbi:nuclear transport factor 2 family protein [Microbacterium hydrothermale]|uniref:nuclear transport factor 2 family protein n=1 Tax=Microbacterium hydrothermale TaxID=857427 RepID=UPI00142D8B1F|nr:nuclear transport factor 2 family protein [Microbacterium hydrothermale]